MLWLLLKRGLVITSIGLVTGLVTAIVTTGLLSTLLFEVEPTDPMTYISVAALLGITSLVATCIPSRWSAKIDPLVALRYE